MKIRNSASELAIALLRIAFFSKPRSSCQTWRNVSSGCAAAKASIAAFVSGPDPSSAMQIESGSTVCRATEVRHSVSARGLL